MLDGNKAASEAGLFPCISMEGYPSEESTLKNLKFPSLVLAGLLVGGLVPVEDAEARAKRSSSSKMMKAPAKAPAKAHAGRYGSSPNAQNAAPAAARPAAPAQAAAPAAPAAAPAAGGSMMGGVMGGVVGGMVGGAVINSLFADDAVADEAVVEEGAAQ